MAREVSGRTWFPAPLALVVLVFVTACGTTAAPAAPSPATLPAAPSGVPGASAAASPNAPKPDPLVGRAGGVTFRVPAGWTVRNEGALAVARNKEKDAGFVVAGFAQPGDAPIAFHRADDEFGVHFPVGLGSQQLPLGHLPYTFRLTQEEAPQNGRIARLSVLMGRGPKPELPYLTVLVYVGVSAGPEREAEGRSHGETFEGIFATFDEDRSGAPAVAASPEPALPPASSAPARVEMPMPLTRDEQKFLAESCKPLLASFRTAVAASKALGRLGTTLDGMQATLAAPPKLPAAKQSKCLSLFERETRGYLIDAMGVEAKTSLGMLARAMTEVVEEKGPLCASSVHPVPATLPDFYTKVPRSTWDEPAWRCLHVDGVFDRTSVQLETRTDAARGTMLLRARGAPFRDGRVAEWTLEGQVQGGHLKIGAVTMVR